MDHIGQTAAEKQGDIGNIFRCRKTSKRCSRQGGVENLLPVGKFFQCLGVNGTGTDGIDIDPPRAQFHSVWSASRPAAVRTSHVPTP